MNALWAAFISIGALVVGYAVYGRFIATRILRIDPSRPTPAHTQEDGVDYVPTKPSILFGHHFASIAGLGPILGPAIAVIWGWLPGVLWVIFGSIFIGAVHDFASLFISIRNRGQSVATVTETILGRRGRLLFLLIVFFLLALAMGVFAHVVAILFSDINPEAVIPVFSLMLIAMLIGLLVYRFKVSLAISTLIGLVLMFAMIEVGVRNPVSIYQYFLPQQLRTEFDAAAAAVAKGKKFYTNTGELADSSAGKPDTWQLKPQVPASFEQYMQARSKAAPGMPDENAVEVNKAANRGRLTWKLVLLAYAFIASVLPVWLLLQPRDYLNSFQLYLGVIVMLIGMIVLAPTVAAPALRGYDAGTAGSFTTVLFKGTAGIKRLLPLLFVTIACGAVSGFHSLVASGTTAKQINSERHARLIGYGGMVAEGILAIIIIFACTAGMPYLDGDRFLSNSSPEQLNARWLAHYGSWKSAEGLPTKLAAVTRGGGLFMSRAGAPLKDGGIPLKWSITFIALICVGFAMTTLDSGTRLLRYNIEELGGATGLRLLCNRYFASALAVLALAFFALYKDAQGKPAGLALWQLFGASNQLLASLVLLIVSVYLFKRRIPVRYTVIPMIFMGGMTVWALTIKMSDFIAAKNWRLLGVTSVILVIALWLSIEAVLASVRAVRRREPAA